ncbi:hypothetical protein CAEBREN_07525 [Caenorhabditis brenneri]|uniref:Uncharacterized protein n=1 Tax=Caenorhabditis brenneri TaxID=135651 RepID=G0P046_CAEBE|nr:hypothetical protein CAEBREN_07525 [Caenorhabditis brenneri]
MSDDGMENLLVSEVIESKVIFSLGDVHSASLETEKDGRGIRVGNGDDEEDEGVDVNEDRKKEIDDTQKAVDEFDKENEGKQLTQTIVEFTTKIKAKKEESGITTKDVLNYIDATMDIVKGSCKIGAVVAPEFAPIILAVAGVAAFVQAFLKLVPDDTPDPVDEKLKELEKSLIELEKKANAGFADLKVFVTEIEFTVEALSEVSTQMRFLRDVLKRRSPESIECFKDAYELNCPLLQAYNLSSLLDQKSTNPLRMDMDNEKVKTKATFEKWENAIGGALSQLILIEAFGSGLFKKKNMFNAERILERSKTVADLLKYLRQKYEKDEKYWDEFKGSLDNYATTHAHLDNGQKAKGIAAKLDTYLTSDSFHICVFNETHWPEDFTYHCPNEKTQLIRCLNKGKCNIYVYRSRTGNQKEQEDFIRARDEIEKHRPEKLKLTPTAPLSQMIKTQLLTQESMKEYGFILIVEEGRNPFPEYANCPKYVKGPGSWQLVYLDVQPAHLKESLRKKTMMLSFP